MIRSYKLYKNEIGVQSIRVAELLRVENADSCREEEVQRGVERRLLTSPPTMCPGVGMA